MKETVVKWQSIRKIPAHPLKWLCAAKGPETLHLKGTISGVHFNASKLHRQNYVRFSLANKYYNET